PSPLTLFPYTTLFRSFFLTRRPLLSKDRLKPSITTGTTTGLNLLMIWAVPFLKGFQGVVVPWGKVITQPSSKAFAILLISLNFTDRKSTRLNSSHVKI